jgi:DNA invertase Pin-like site-specific DNA recombinase
MAEGKFVAYYRVSTVRQGHSGLGLDAQRDAVTRFLNGGNHELVAEFKETETGKGSHALEKRPQLKAAMDACKAHSATLVIAKLDRLSRNVRFIAELMESRVRFVACDMPEANELTLHVMAAFAEHEAKRISERTKEALAQAKKRGVKLGRKGRENLELTVVVRRVMADDDAKRMLGQIKGFRARGLSLRQMVAELNAVGIKAPNGGRWHYTQLRRTIERLRESGGLKD